MHDTSAIPVCPSQFPHEGTEPRSVACGMCGRYLRFGPAATVHTPALVQYPVRHLHRDRGQLDHLMRVVRLEQGNVMFRTHTARGSAPAPSWGEERLAMARMARFPTALRGVVDVMRRRGFL